MKSSLMKLNHVSTFSGEGHLVIDIRMIPRVLKKAVITMATVIMTNRKRDE
jgi:hypothetical protein